MFKFIKALSKPFSKTIDTASNGSFQFMKENQNIRVFATTVIRGENNPDLTGFLLEIGWAENKIIKQIPIPIDTANPYWNSRGGNRGGRGLVAYNKVLYVATATSILKYNTNLEQIGEISHPYLAGLHELYIEQDGIWTTSTVHDLVMKISFEGKIIDEWWGSESAVLQEYFGYSGRTLNVGMNFTKASFEEGYEQYCKEERLHINSVFNDNDGLYVLSNRKNAIIKVRPLPEKIICVDEQLLSPHNLIITSDGLAIVNNTQRQTVNVYDLKSATCKKIIPTSVFEEARSEQFAKAGWQRGLAHVKDSVYLVGTSPATIFEVDIDSGEIGQVCHLDNDVRHCIHGLTVTDNF